MRARIVVVLLAVGAVSAPLAVSADDLSAAEALLCSASWAVVCTEEEVCESGPPEDWGIPQFIEVDLVTRVLSTTAASHENRSTTAEVLRRADGVISIHGMELGRAFSIVVSEETGRLSSAIAAEDFTISVFGDCTPVERKE